MGDVTHEKPQLARQRTNSSDRLDLLKPANLPSPHPKDTLSPGTWLRQPLIEGSSLQFPDSDERHTVTATKLEVPAGDQEKGSTHAQHACPSDDCRRLGLEATFLEPLTAPSSPTLKRKASAAGDEVRVSKALRGEDGERVELPRVLKGILKRDTPGKLPAKRKSVRWTGLPMEAEAASSSTAPSLAPMPILPRIKLSLRSTSSRSFSMSMSPQPNTAPQILSDMVVVGTVDDSFDGIFPPSSPPAQPPRTKFIPLPATLSDAIDEEQGIHPAEERKAGEGMLGLDTLQISDYPFLLEEIDITEAAENMDELSSWIALPLV